MVTTPVLVTGFVPFANYAVNSSEQVVRTLATMLPADQVRCEILPVDHVAAHVRMTELLTELRPRVCLATGMWQGDAFRIERVARRCPGLAHVPGDDELAGHWDWAAMLQTLERTRRPMVFSDDAGKYVCDTTYWSLLAHRQKWGWPDTAAFLHLPPVSADWPVEVMAAGVAEVLRWVLAGGVIR